MGILRQTNKEASTVARTGYPPVIAELIEERRLNSLGPGVPNKDAYPKLRDLTTSKLFEGQTIRDSDMAACCLSGLWIYHNYLDESHEISQEIHTPTGSYWHGIMHRREPDYGNSSYWFRRVGTHPTFDILPQAVALSIQEFQVEPETEFLQNQSRWDPFAFIDLCRSAYNKQNEYEALCLEIQLCEWEVLFAYCYQMSSCG
ncbi:MAG: hypothetical protein ACFCD0_20025 [Gemmataceae bacterium]